MVVRGAQPGRNLNISLEVGSVSAVVEVTADALGSNFQIDGASGASNTYSLDGQEATNFRTGQLNTANNFALSETTVSDALVSGKRRHYRCGERRGDRRPF